MKFIITTLLLIIVLGKCSLGINDRKNLSVADYTIYSIIINSGNGSQSNTKQRLLINSTTIEAPKALMPVVMLRDENLLTPALAIAVDDFEKKNEEKVTLQNKFSLNIQYSLVNAEELSNMDKETFDKQYPDAYGTMKFSRVGYNADKTTAFVYRDFSCGPLCGSGKYYIFTKTQVGWQLDKSVSAFVS